jgi:hypothetical protein
VNKKLQMMFESLQGKGSKEKEREKQQANAELQDLLAQMRKVESLKDSDMQLLNQKISFIETLMAEQNAEGEMMKKHYYSLSSNRIKGKVGDFTHQRTKVANAYNSIRQNPGKNKQPQPKLDTKKPLFKETTSNKYFTQIKNPTNSPIVQTMSHIDTSSGCCR